MFESVNGLKVLHSCTMNHSLLSGETYSGRCIKAKYWKIMEVYSELMHFSQGQFIIHISTAVPWANLISFCDTVAYLRNGLAFVMDVKQVGSGQECICTVKTNMAAAPVPGEV